MELQEKQKKFFGDMREMIKDPQTSGVRYYLI